jgi:hypothetical protein
MSAGPRQPGAQRRLLRSHSNVTRSERNRFAIAACRGAQCIQRLEASENAGVYEEDSRERRKQRIEVASARAIATPKPKIKPL